MGMGKQLVNFINEECSDETSQTRKFIETRLQQHDEKWTKSTFRVFKKGKIIAAI
jgi:hypothetical protein